MDPWEIAFIAAAVSLCLSLARLWYARSGGDYGQIARVERKMDLTILGGVVNGGWPRAAGTGRQCGLAAPFGLARAVPELHR